ncbi:MAG: DUF4974 domain-containing protein [Bacteroidales bacterium]|nr:DUF4974 domain-containing protein [Bacteroidales bacterium]MDD3988693.1 DUF4974 domain-containing protein [Bacteroidales bacterium]MDD4639244.1 DUF4974 domain-containing protein [Bacteroidales bacterium]
MNYTFAHKLASIIIKIRLEKATDQEREILLSWLDENEINRQTYKRIISGESLLKRLRTEEKITDSTDMDLICKTIANKLMRREFNRRIVYPVSIAAGCIVLLISGWLVLGDKNIPQKTFTAENGSKVQLITESGKVINLDKTTPDSIDVATAVIVHKENSLEYMAKKESGITEEKEVKNKIITGVGGEYLFTLSDGTKVWLNALSEIEFPVNFHGDRRVVNLTGEAYFQVKSNDKKPFIVHSLNQSVQVLGTSFNIKAYPDEYHVYTTLLEGSLSVGSGGNKVLLNPGMESVCSRESNELEIRHVNTNFAVAWRSGYFMFNDEDLDNILTILSRWYGVKFVYDEPVTDKNTFSGRLSKYNDISTTLNSITMTGGPAFSIDRNRNTVHISSIRQIN